MSVAKVQDEKWHFPLQIELRMISRRGASWQSFSLQQFDFDRGCGAQFTPPNDQPSAPRRNHESKESQVIPQISRAGNEGGI
jgi:hypothetical protein